MSVESTTDTQTLAFEIYKMIRETSQDIVQDQRDVAVDAADAELDHGLSQADEIDEQADAALSGAIAGAVFTVAGGIAEGYFASGVAVSGRDALSPAAAQAQNLVDQGKLQVASSIGDLASPAEGWFDAAGQHHAAGAAREDAKGTYEGRTFEQAQSTISTALDNERGAKDAYELIRDAGNESMMTALSQRA
jgi:hypothetical protein